MKFEDFANIYDLKFNLLVIENKSQIYNLLKDMDIDDGISCLKANTIQEAMNALFEKKISLIILDEAFENKDYIEVIALIRNKTKVPITVLMRNDCTADDLKEIYSFPSIEHINKPIIYRVLKCKILTYFDFSKRIEDAKHNGSNDLIQRMTFSEQSSLKMLEEGYRALFNNINDCVIVYSINKDGLPGKFIDLNNNTCETYGYTRKELMNMTLPDIFENQESSDIISRMIKLFSQKHLAFDSLTITKNGKRIPVEVNAHMFFQKEKPAVICLLRDLTDKIEKERALNESAEIYKQMFENNTAIMLMIYRETGNIFNANPFACKFYGYSVQKMKTMSIFDISQLSRQELENRLDDIKNSNRVYFESIHRIADGSKKDVSINFTKVEIFGQKLIFCVINDISEYKKTELALKRREKILEVLRNSAEKFLLSGNWEKHLKEELASLGKQLQVSRVFMFRTNFDKSGKIFANPYYEWVNVGIEPIHKNPLLQNISLKNEGLGRWQDILSKGEILYGTIDEFPENEQKIMRKLDVQAIILVPIFTQSYRWGTIGIDASKNHRKWRKIEIDSLKAYADIISASIANKSTKEKLIKTLKRLKHFNKEMERFAFIISNDLEASISSIVEYNQLIEEEYKQQLGKKGIKYVNNIISHGKKLSMMLQELYTYTVVLSDNNKFEKCDLNKLFDEVLNEMQKNIANCGAKINHSSLPIIFADRYQIKLVLTNLLENAIRYSRNGDSPVINFKAVQENNHWLFSFSDKGIGIDERFGEKLFQIFNRIRNKEIYPEKGIGLAICKRIIERHDGDIYFESKAGKGTTFYFTLPIKSDWMEYLNDYKF